MRVHSSFLSVNWRVAAFSSGLVLLACTAGLAAPPPVRFSRQVLPVLERECQACHSGSAPQGGFSLETQAKLLAGGRHGAALVPGKSKQSNLIRYLTGELQPQMPPGKPLAPSTIALLRRWIDEGAKIDSFRASSPGALASPPTAAVRARALPGTVAPVTALAYSPDGKRLAVGGYRVVRLVDPVTGAITHTLPGPVDQVLALAWSSDGRWLAAAGGLPGVHGEICIWNTATWVRPRFLKQHTDTIYGIAWRPRAPEFAAASLDKTVTIWNSANGTVVRTLKDHADAVFAVAYSPDGHWLATGSADRSVKLYRWEGVQAFRLSGFQGNRTEQQDPQNLNQPGRAASAGAPVRPAAALSHPDGVSALAFGPKSDLLVSACLDKRVRVWPVKAEAIEKPTRTHEEGEPVNAVAFSADGSLFLWGAVNHKVRIWNAEVSERKQEMSDATDWVYAVAASPDGKTVAAGAGDGKIYWWNGADGKLIRSQTMGGAVALAAKQGEDQ
jgi:WD40 repeat protein